MDANAERRALRTRIMALRGVEVVGASDLVEAASIWQRDRYAMVLIDIRRDYRGCWAWRNEIKKQQPDQLVAFLVGRPQFVDFKPAEDSYVREEHGSQWGDSLRHAIRKSCESLPQRYSFAEASWRITAARKINGAGMLPETGRVAAAPSIESSFEPASDHSELLDSTEHQWRLNEFQSTSHISRLRARPYSRQRSYPQLGFAGKPVEAR